MATISDIILKVIDLTEENEKLKEENYQLKQEIKSLKAELRKPERMTAEESMAYWGIFG